MQIPGRQQQFDDEVVDVHHVTAEYFQTLSIPMLHLRANLQELQPARFGQCTCDPWASNEMAGERPRLLDGVVRASAGADEPGSKISCENRPDW